MRQATSDIAILVKNLVAAIEPFARKNKLELSFSQNLNAFEVQHDPYLLISSVSWLICRMINLLPPGNQIEVRLNKSSGFIVIEIENTGINLMPLKMLTNQSGYTFSVHPKSNGSIYSLKLYTERQEPGDGEASGLTSQAIKLPSFYAEFTKRLRSHFTRLDSILATLSKTNPGDAQFLRNVNNLIYSEMHNESFDSAELSAKLFLSRSQLFRRMKPLVNMAPAQYIRLIRLHRAKELLETTDFNVGEIATECGFSNMSQFSRIFQQHFGVLPSVYKRQRHATN